MDLQAGVALMWMPLLLVAASLVAGCTSIFNVRIPLGDTAHSLPAAVQNVVIKDQRHRERMTNAMQEIADELVRLDTARDKAAATDIFASAELAPFSLSCQACMLWAARDCAPLAQLPVVAVVSGLDVVTGFKECLRSDHSGDSQPCYMHRASRFDRVSFITNRRSARATDVFYSEHWFDLTDPQRHSGVFLLEDRTYLIFGGRSDVPTDPAADWSIEAACEIPSARTSH